ncbi:putative DnaJ domain, Chaperone J-domain superfamily [Helianthus annuus]|nr:putative DnaJ domain, Chaperone J-domain superfamily [Helianthus annuus]
MESLSRPFHSKNLSDAPYDVVFSGNRRKYSQPSPIPLQDYREIFSTSQASSIPVLDLSTLTQPVDSLSFNFKDLKPDYSKIFGGFCDESVAVSYEELFGCDKVRAPSSTSPSSQDSDDLSRQSPDALKQFSMSYNKIIPKSKDGLDGTKHVTQVPPVTGFTCFVDEPVMEAKKPNLSAFNIKSSRNAVRKENNPVESISEDKKAKTFDVDFKRRPSMVSSSPIGVVNDKDDSKRSVNSEPRKTDFDEEIDVNSAAFALKKAIEKAQESIRIAKESVGRKKNGLRSFSNNKFKNNSKVEEQKRRDEDSSQGFQDVGRNRKYGGTVVLPSFTESEKLFVAKKFIDEIHEKISESVKDSKFVDDTVASNATQVTSKTEAKPADSAGKDEHANMCCEAVDTETSKIQTSDFVHECQTDNKIVDECEAEIEVSEPAIDILEHQTVVKELESEENANEVSEDSNRNDNENRLDASLELLENEKQENVVEHEEVEYEESEKHEEIEEASELVESEKESEHDRNSEIRKGEDSEVNLHDDCETKQEDDHAVESKGERLDKSCDQEFDEKSVEDDDVIEETVDTDRVHVASNDVEMNDVNVETTQDIEVSCEFQAEEADFCEKTSIDRTVSDNNESEYEVKSDESNIIDNLADLGIENDARSESSSGSRHGDEIVGGESNIIDNPSDLGSETDARSESSSNSTQGEKVIDEERNIQSPRNETPNTENTNEIKETIVEESGPSKVSRKDRVKTIDEEAAAKEREWEKNRLAVDRAIREARERAFAEARERAERERAAVEKATEEVRQRMMAEAHEKVSKASVMKKSSSDKTSAQSKLRAERAAVERATAEARQRALEKAISQKTASELNRSESALRTKAKLEKHNRIMERAAKALAEKEKRDRLAQKEQAERNRLAENLDADIKRWSNGKEGNLRALLSTLQYILGPESGWQPVTLTEIITTSAVKKAYRKATLCVHPDKLQQRGATIQQKYICEKVFDLLKAAWNKFNSEER